MFNEKTLKFIRIFLLVLIVLGGVLLLTQKSWVPKVTNYILEKQNYKDDTKTGSKWTGKISAVRNDCIFDGMCTITVSGYEVVVVQGMVALQDGEEVGSLKGVDSVSDASKYIGKEANVYAKRIDNRLYTLYGNKDFYIEILK